jgi:hypothetical protein
MYLKAIIQKATDFGYFANFGREQTSEANIFSYYYSIYIFLSRLFILSGCGMAGKICGGKKNTKNLSLC